MKKRILLYVIILSALVITGCSGMNSQMPDASGDAGSASANGATSDTAAGQGGNLEATPGSTHNATQDPGLTATLESEAIGTQETVTGTTEEIGNAATQESGMTADHESGTAQNPTDETNVISKEEAKRIALDRVSGATAQDIKEFETDYDNGTLQYEGKIHYQEKEYEFEIDAHSGEILEWEIDPIYKDTTQ